MWDVRNTNAIQLAYLCEVQVILLPLPRKIRKWWVWILQVPQFLSLNPRSVWRWLVRFFLLVTLVLHIKNVTVAVPLPTWVTGAFKLLQTVLSKYKEKSHSQPGNCIMEGFLLTTSSDSILFPIAYGFHFFSTNENVNSLWFWGRNKFTIIQYTIQSFLLDNNHSFRPVTCSQKTCSVLPSTPLMLMHQF